MYKKLMEYKEKYNDCNYLVDLLLVLFGFNYFG